MEKEQKEQNEELVHVSKECEVFKIVKGKQKYFITLNVFKISEHEFDTIEEAEEYIQSKPYEILINTMFAIQNLEKNANTDKN